MKIKIIKSFFFFCMHALSDNREPQNIERPNDQKNDPFQNFLIVKLIMIK